MSARGTLYGVGVGPGDPELMSLKAARILKSAPVIAYFATLKGMSRTAARQRAFELLERYGLKDFAAKPTEALSKGMGQKVQMLASIAHDPEFVILDEPFSGLDPVNQQVMEEIIRDMAARKHTILFSTHVMQHAERLALHHRVFGDPGGVARLFGGERDNGVDLRIERFNRCQISVEHFERTYFARGNELHRLACRHAQQTFVGHGAATFPTNERSAARLTGTAD